MFISCIRKLFLLSIMVVFAFSGKAQLVHFVYLQTENGQPFYVKINNKLISSSAEGYIILPDLKDGDYQLVVGFPKKEFPEENFNLTIEKKNEGFLIKNFGEKGWQLFNLQTLALTQGTNEGTIAMVEKKEADPFSTMLASVVKDSSILQDHQAVPPPVKAVDTLAEQVEKVNTMPDTLSSAVPKESSLISMILNKEDTDGLQRVYEDKNDGPDTIRIFFPSDTTTQSPDLNQDSSKNNIEKNIMRGRTPVVDNNSEFTITPTIVPGADSASGNENKNALNDIPSNDTLIAGEPVRNDKEILQQQNETQITQQSDNRPQQDNSSKNSEAQIILLPKEVTSSKVNSDCKAFATNEDFLKLRKKMASEYDAENMIKIAKKYLKLKCYSTEQIKDLSYLFLKDEGKYMFFDAAYPFTSDSDQYQILQSQLTDEYYLTRFKAMIRK